MNLASVHPVTPEITTVYGWAFAKRIDENWHIAPVICGCNGQIINRFSESVNTEVKMTINHSLSGRCYGNQLILGAIR